jgi:cardiolipin synthase
MYVLPIRQARLLLCLAWMAVVVGCQTPARFAPARRPTARKAHLTWQVLGDTAAECATHPVQSGHFMLTGPLDFLDNAGRDVGKRVGLWKVRKGGRPRVPGSEGPLWPAHICLYPEGEEALAALEEVIDGARHRLDVLMYTWDQGPVGMHIARKLAARAGPDLPVRVLVDDGGNLVFSEPGDAPADEIDRALLWLSCQPHVEVIRARNPFGRFDHRKLVLADGRVAWTGGRNFTANDFFTRHDLTFTVTGPLVARMQELFERSWCRQGGQAAGPVPAGGCDTCNAWARLVETTPTRHELKRTLYRNLDGARASIWLENPYLCDAGLINRLLRARRRGVEVCVVLSVDDDTRTINRANRVTANRLLGAGCRIYLAPGPLHTKAALVDGAWLYVGTGNFDTLSLRRNRELGVIVEEGSLIAEVAGCIFVPDFRPDWEVREPLPLAPGDVFLEVLASWFL